MQIQNSKHEIRNKLVQNKFETRKIQNPETESGLFRIFHLFSSFEFVSSFGFRNSNIYFLTLCALAQPSDLGLIRPLAEPLRERFRMHFFAPFAFFAANSPAPTLAHDGKSDGIQNLFENFLRLGPILRLIPGGFLALDEFGRLRAWNQRAAVALDLVQ